MEEIENNRKRRSSGHFSPEAKAFAERLFWKGKGWTEIARALEDMTDVPPTPKTVSNWAKEWKRDAEAPWGFTAANLDWRTGLLRVLPELIEGFGKEAMEMSGREADLIGWLAVAVPDMPPEAMFVWVRRYLRNVESGQPAADLIAYLAFAPWRDRGRRYLRALDSPTRGFSSALALAAEDSEWLGARVRHVQSFTMGAVIAARRDAPN